MPGEITRVIVFEYGQEEFIRRLSDPFWFQGFGCILGFDWHSSGLTTTVTGALKEAVKAEETGLAVCGGKGTASRKTPQEIEELGGVLSLSTSRIGSLVRASRLSAKVDNTAVQDGYSLYHHVMVFTEKGSWSVVQQGMNPGNRYARRYHWLSENLHGFVEEPHNAICCDSKGRDVLDMTAGKSREARDISLDVARESPANLQRFFSKQSVLGEFTGNGYRILHMPRSHCIMNMDRTNLQTLQKVYEIQPGDYEELLSISGVGAKTVRALAMVSELVYGKPPSWEDPVRFSFAHGGKDGIPYPVDREAMDRSIEILRTGIEEARIGKGEKLNALKRLQGFV